MNNVNWKLSEWTLAPVLFFLLIVALIGVVIESYAGPYGRFFGMLHPERQHEFVPLGMLVVWTSVFGLAIFILFAGYHYWRRVCPLAWFSQLSRHLNQGRKSNLRNTWLEKHSYDLRLAMLAFSLGIARLLFINSDCYLLLWATLLLFGTAFLTNVFFAGKTWCHYLCPMGPVEEVLASARLLITEQGKPKNSKCISCSACKTACPDIDSRKAHWKDILSPSRRRFQYSYWGLVLGFYVWYYLHRGTFSYYLSSEWTREGNVIASLFLPGFFFWPAVPKWVAAPLTELVFMGMSYAFWLAVEQFYGRYLAHSGAALTPEILRSRVFQFSNGLSVLTFFAFASAPGVYRLLGMPGVLLIPVALVALVGAYRTWRAVKPTAAAAMRGITGRATAAPGH